MILSKGKASTRSSYGVGVDRSGLMLLRAPWLRGRLPLVGLAAWDFAGVTVCYACNYLTSFGMLPTKVTSLTAVTLTWVGVSYIAGRYSPDEKGGNTSIIALAIKTIAPMIAAVSLIVGHSWIYDVVETGTKLRGFVIPTLTSISIWSLCGAYWFHKATERPKEWIVVCSEDEYNIVQQEVQSWSHGTDVKCKLSRAEKGSILDKSDMMQSSADLAIGSAMEGAFEDELLELKRKGRKVISLSSWCELYLQRIPPELVTVDWLLKAEGFGLRPGELSWRVKRLGDVVGSIMLIIFTLPIVAVTVLAILAEDGGPVLYSQQRTGLYGESFKIWKLRSMRKDAERMGAQWARAGDKRITRVGRVIRATRIDELPQLVNVLRGDMSMIGPRPERSEIETGLMRKIPHYKTRSWIRPGLSGWAQVSYPYGASISDSRMKLSYDIYYVRNAGFLLDMLIIAKTLRLVLNAKGASPITQRVIS